MSTFTKGTPYAMLIKRIIYIQATMPNIKSAKKELRKSIKRAAHNAKIKDNINLLTKKTKKAIAASDDTAKDLFKGTMKALDKAAKKGLIKKNAANRKKSRLHKKLNAVVKAVKK